LSKSGTLSSGVPAIQQQRIVNGLSDIMSIPVTSHVPMGEHVLASRHTVRSFIFFHIFICFFIVGLIAEEAQQ